MPVSHNSIATTKNSMFWAACAGALVIAVGMGFSRFAYTGVYPVMVNEGLLTVQDGTLAASANYAGYLFGALFAAKLASHQARRWVLISIAGSILCMFALALAATPWAVVVIRGLAGILSALCMIAASLWLLQHHGYQRGAPLLFAGVGVGIFASAELLALGQYFGFKSPALWLVLGVGASLFAALAMLRLDNTQSKIGHATDSEAMSGHTPLAAWSLIVCYGLAGFGYIITATYLPMLVKDSLGDVNPAHVWAVFGLGAAPSCYLWHRFHLRYGTRAALRANLVAQAFGVVLPVLLPNAIGFLGSALIVGGTFMGTVTIAMPAAKKVSHTIKFNLIAIMTAAYGVGQIIGPLLASRLYSQSGTFSSSLVAAATGLLLSAALTLRYPTIR